MSDRKTASFEEFKAYTIAVARGEKPADPTQPKIWAEPATGSKNSFADDSSDGRPRPRSLAADGRRTRQLSKKT